MAMELNNPPDNSGLPDPEDYEGLLEDYSHFAPPAFIQRSSAS